MDEMKTENPQLKSAIARLLSAFPADDVDGHHRYHMSVIEWREALTKMVGAGVLATTGWLVVTLWQAFKVNVTK